MSNKNYFDINNYEMVAKNDFKPGDIVYHRHMMTDHLLS